MQWELEKQLSLSPPTWRHTLQAPESVGYGEGLRTAAQRPAALGEGAARVSRLRLLLGVWTRGSRVPAPALWMLEWDGMGWSEWCSGARDGAF